MATQIDLTSDQAAQAMLDGLMTVIKASLRERIMERIRPDIDAAVEAGCSALQVAVQGWQDPVMMRAVVKVLIEDRRAE